MFILAIFYTDGRGEVYLFLGACAGVYFFVRGFLVLQKKRVILNTPGSKVRSAAMGLVELSGLATGPYSVIAPITGRPCYYYRTILWKWKRQGRSSGWVKEGDESLHVPFYLDDNTGKILVDPQGAELDIHCDFKEEFTHSLFSSTLEIPTNVGIFASRHGVGSEDRIKIEEYCIKPKNSLFILGTLAHNPMPALTGQPVSTVHGTVWMKTNISFGSLFGSFLPGSGHSSDFGEVPAIPMPHHAPLEEGQQEKVAAAMMKAGITNPAAWAAAGVTPTTGVAHVVSASGASVATALAPEQFDPHPSTVLMKGNHGSPFLISWQSQRDVIRSLSWKSDLMIWGGPALTLVCIYFLALEFGWL
jgi:hypothetical protein